MTAYRYDGTFAGFLTCAWDALERGIDPEAFLLPDGGASLWEVWEPATDREKARRLYAVLKQRVSPAFQKLIARGFLTCLPDRELWLWRFLRLAYEQGPKIGRNLTDPTVDKVRKAVWHLEHEAHQYKGFTRFSELEGILVGEIEPKNQVLPLLRPHFCGRYPQECFVLHDRTHHAALFHRPGPRGWNILPVENFSPGPAGETELTYRKLWRTFYDTIAIEGRYNPKCRMTNMPKRYWAMMTEFQKDWDTALPEVKGV